MISPDGRQLVARDEATGTTKIFDLPRASTEACVERLDLGVQTGKVGFHHTGRYLAFSIPRGVVQDGQGVLWISRNQALELRGIFVLDRQEMVMTRVAGSAGVGMLTFPDFVGDTAVVFQVESPNEGTSRLRVSPVALDIEGRISR